MKVAVDYTKEQGNHVGYFTTVLKNWARKRKTKEDAERKVKPKQQEDDFLAKKKKELFGG